MLRVGQGAPGSVQGIHGCYSQGELDASLVDEADESLDSSFAPVLVEIAGGRFRRTVSVLSPSSSSSSCGTGCKRGGGSRASAGVESAEGCAGVPVVGRLPWDMVK